MNAAPGVDTERRTPQVRLRPILITFGVIVLVMVSLRFVAEPMRVSSDSMSPTFTTGDEVLVQKLGARARRPSSGDVVVVRSPASGDLMIKRVAALGGQTVGIADGVLKVDGREVANRKVPHTIPFIMAIDETFDVGVDTRTPVDDKDYQVPFRFTGKISKLSIRLGPEELMPAEKKATRKKLAERD